MHTPMNLTIRLAAATALALTLTACGGATATATATATSDDATAPMVAGYKNFSPAQVQAKLTEPGFHVYDVNSPERYAKGHVPGAKNASYKTLSADQLPTDKNATLVFYCGSTKCKACHKAADVAKELGYTNASIMAAGIKGWEDAGLATEGGAGS